MGLESGGKKAVFYLVYWCCLYVPWDTRKLGDFGEKNNMEGTCLNKFSLEESRQEETLRNKQKQHDDSDETSIEHTLN